MSFRETYFTKKVPLLIIFHVIFIVIFRCFLLFFVIFRYFLLFFSTFHYLSLLMITFRNISYFVSFFIRFLNLPTYHSSQKRQTHVWILLLHFWRCPSVLVLSTGYAHFLFAPVYGFIWVLCFYVIWVLFL